MACSWTSCSPLAFGVRAATAAARVSRQVSSRATRPPAPSYSSSSSPSHAPHGTAALSQAGPSRCFCSSHQHRKSSSAPAPAPALAPTIYDESFARPSPFYPIDHDKQSHSFDAAPSQPNDFFTPSAPTSATRTAGKGKARSKPDDDEPLWTETLPKAVLDATLARANTFLGSGERSLPALARAVRPEASAEQVIELQWVILRRAIDAGMKGVVVDELYRSTTSPSSDGLHLPSAVFTLQRNTLHRCFKLFLSERLESEAAAIASDGRLQPALARHMVSKLLFSLAEPEERARPQQTVTRAARDTRLALQKLSHVICALMAKGVEFKPAVIQRAALLLCHARAYGHLIRLVRSAQQQRTRVRAPCEATETADPPSVPSTSVLERICLLLVRQGRGGGKAAADLLALLPITQRTAQMYDAVISHRAAVPVSLFALERKPDGRLFAAQDATLPPPPHSLDTQLWIELCTHEHLGGPTESTFSSRLLAHAAAKRVNFIREDLEFLVSQGMGATSEKSLLASIYALTRVSDLTSAFRTARFALSPLDAGSPARTRIYNSLLVGALGMRPVSRESRALRLRRFIIRLRRLAHRHPFVPDRDSLHLLIRALVEWDHFVDTDRLATMLASVASAGLHNAELLRTFAYAFERRGDQDTADKLQQLLERQAHVDRHAA